MQDWITNISENKGLIYVAIAKDRAKIVERIKKGLIPIVMPSRTVQELRWKVAITNLKPVWFEGGIKETVYDSNYYDVFITEKMNQSGFFQNIPDRPYLVWAKPAQDLNPFTLNKSFDDQQAYLAKLVAEYPALYDQTDIIPTEYRALQAVFTSTIYEHYQDLKGATSEPTIIRPFDCNRYHTRFLSVGLLPYGYIPYATFMPDTHTVSFRIDLTGARLTFGFRPVSRS